MKLLQSKKLQLPHVYFITDRKEIKDIPIGVPFIYGHESEEKYLVRILEYEVLYQAALKSGYPFNFKKILKDAGYIDLQDFRFQHPPYLEFMTEELLEEEEFDAESTKHLSESCETLSSYIKDSSAYVDVTKLKELNVFPVWLDTIENAINTNIHNFAVFNNNMYNKKLEGMYGGLELVSPNRNLIIIDISGSIPKAVSSTCLALAKNLADSFYADLLITGSKSTLYKYEEIHSLDVEGIYQENGMDNDQVWFKKLVTSEERIYKTAIVFGDNHTPCDKWRNSYNTDSTYISREDGQKMCKWKIDKLISFHTKSTEWTAGYADWFVPKEVEKIANWVKYLD
jgi:hypothetical protein